ncbi:unnamed protein product [Didymodactylos carnosus]|uniref:Uncharacterized protein n=1 Tax=Didymodactylos carnosus TaxID=1234261 RepID=A0A814W9Y2_9BILA|nr:unnamed protein product [Didymodactylos carnosus]CAF3965741.1 unnamed protein product [Didymodactylos carnosus]
MVKRAQKIFVSQIVTGNLWLSIIIAVPTVTVLYLLTNISYFTVMTKAALLSSNAVAVTWGESVLGPVVRALPILISISALGSLNGGLYTGGRYSMVGARYGYLPEVFSCIQNARKTPLPGIVLEVKQIQIFFQTFFDLRFSDVNID